MKLIWLTDIHLNFLDHEARMDFYQTVMDASGDCIIISGDIADARWVSKVLKEMATTIQKPIYFVLGNHDYYHSSVAAVRQEITDLCHHEAGLYWLPASGPQDLGNETILLGVDGWADGRYGDYTNSLVVLNDSHMIQELFEGRILGKYPLLDRMQHLADQDAKFLNNQLRQVIQTHHPKKIMIVTHVPPFREACMYEGKITHDDYLPFFSSKVTGDTLMQIAQENKKVEFLVFCGHTHSKGYCQPCANLKVTVGESEYSYPKVQEVITL